MPRTARVLVVDDDRTIATTLAMILNKSGFEAEAAFSGPDALQLAHRSHFDFLVTDVVMEPMNGVRLGTIFRNLNPVARIILFTGTEDTAQLLLSTANAGYDFQILRKPVHPEQILEALRSSRSEVFGRSVA